MDSVDEQLFDCRHLGEQYGYSRDADGAAWHPRFRCILKHPESTTIPQCQECRSNQPRRDRPPTPIQVELHPGRHVYRTVGVPIVDRFGHDAAVENLYLGGHVFLILGGPSLGNKDHDLSYLDQHGIIKFGINNVAAAVRCQLWTYGDTSAKFHEVIWKDPGTLKFCPFPKMGDSLRDRLPDGSWVRPGMMPMNCPGVLGIRRNAHFRPDQWLHEDTINWGHGGRAEKHLKKTEGEDPFGYTELSTFFQAVRLCYYLGFRHVYLLGCDFTMGEHYRYAFSEDRHAGAVSSNNSKYRKQAKMFTELRPHFDAAGFSVYNCNKDSKLEAFDYLSYAEAVDRAMEQLPATIDTKGWYESL